MDIEELNQRIARCTDCRLSTTRTNAVCGEGDPGARVMVVAQAPGETEDREGRMFVGPTGRVLDGLLASAGTDRGELYMTNLLKCTLPRCRRPRRDEVEACGEHLEREIGIVDPQVVVTLGYHATRFVLDLLAVPAPGRSDVPGAYGRVLLARGRRVLPLPHPTALLRDDGLRGEMEGMYRKIRVLSADCKWYPTCPMNAYTRMGRLDRKWTELYCRGDWESCVRYGMEERGEPHPDWMLPDGTIDEALRGPRGGAMG
jgi:DNA polymerase